MPDNALAMEINGTAYTIHEYFDGKASVNDIIAKRVESDAEAAGNNSSNLLPPVPG